MVEGFRVFTTDENVLDNGVQWSLYCNIRFISNTLHKNHCFYSGTNAFTNELMEIWPCGIE